VPIVRGVLAWPESWPASGVRIFCDIVEKNLSRRPSHGHFQISFALMTLILPNQDVEKLLPMRECIEVLEAAYIELSEGRGVNRRRSDCVESHRRGTMHSTA
jgi:hypothetical protein